MTTTTTYIHYLPGGGLGDVFREAYFHNALGILRRWKLMNPGEHLTVLVSSHNPSTPDLLAHQPWIDQVLVRPFPFVTTARATAGDWEHVYVEHEDAFAGKTELRFSLYEHRSLYDARKNALRPRGQQWGPVLTIEPVGCTWPTPLTEEEHATVAAHSDRIVVHPYAGTTARAMSALWRDRVLDAAGGRALIIGANYTRDQHGPETGQVFSPRVLVEIIRRARAVIGTESVVWYMGTMLGVPTALLYPEGEAFWRLTQGCRDWDWFFNLNDDRSIAALMPAERYDEVETWVHQWT